MAYQLLPWHSLTTAAWWLHEWLQVQLLSCLITKPLLCSSFSSPLYGTRSKWSPPISLLILTAFVQTFRLSPPPAHNRQAKLNVNSCIGREGFDQSNLKIRMNHTSKPMTATKITPGFPVPCAKFSLHLPRPTFTFQHRKSAVVCHLSARLHSRCNMTKAHWFSRTFFLNPTLLLLLSACLSVQAMSHTISLPGQREKSLKKKSSKSTYIL